MPLLADRIGRKNILVFVNINAIVGTILYYCSKTIEELIISQTILGILFASNITVTVMVTSEYTSPRYRGVLVTLKAATFYWGLWVSNAIGTFFHWRNIVFVAFACCAHNLLCIFYKESPYWLASKTRFDECAKVHRWLKGTDEDSEEELRKLIISQEQLRNKAELKENTTFCEKVTKVFTVIRYKSFYVPLLYALLTISLFFFSGKMVCAVYVIDIIKTITPSEKTAYEGMLVLDAFTVLSTYVGCGLTKVLKRRTQLFVSTLIGMAFLFILSIYLYMINLNILSENKYISLFLLTAYSTAICAGPNIIPSCCMTELTPFKYRSYFLCYLAACNSILFATILKLAPLVFKHLGTHGAFFFYAMSSTVIVLVLYKYLPETKDLTIQEIQERVLQDVYHDRAGIKNETIPLKETVSEKKRNSYEVLPTVLMKSL